MGIEAWLRSRLHRPGNGAHELDTNTITLINGLTANATTAGNTSHFTATLTDRSAHLPLPIHSAMRSSTRIRKSIRKKTGACTRQAIEFALWAMNEQFAPTVPGTTNKQASVRAVQHAGDRRRGLQRRRAALAAAEGDATGLIDGVVVASRKLP